MYILIPVDGEDPKKSKITTLINLKKWALINFDEGITKSVTFWDDRNNTDADWVEFIVLENKFENYLEFMEEGIMVLVRRQEESIEDIIEAFKFKELDEIGI